MNHNPAEMIRDLAFRRQVARNYGDRAKQLEREADALRAEGFTHWADEVDWFAAIALSAQRGEMYDPDPRNDP